MKQLTGKKSLAEVFYGKCLKIIIFLNKRFIFLNKPQKNLIILCYHSVDNGGWRFSVPISNFRKQMEYLKKNKKVISLNEAFGENGSSCPRGVIITFDDGYLDILENAFPILSEMKITAALFAIGEEKTANREELDNNKKLLNIDQLRVLYKAGWTIGFHTKTHACLHSLSNGKLQEEIVESKTEFEKKLGFSIDYFAYPRGIYNEVIINKARKAGFKAAFTVDGGAAFTKNKFAISRISIEGSTGDEEFKAIFSPLGLQFAKLYTQVLKTKEKISNLSLRNLNIR